MSVRLGINRGKVAPYGGHCKAIWNVRYIRGRQLIQLSLEYLPHSSTRSRMNGNRWGGLRSTLVLIAFAATACGSDSKGPEKAGPPATLTVLSGSGQEGESGELLANALTVKAV